MIKNNDTSYGIKYLLSNDVKKTVSKKGIVIRKIIAPKLRKEFAADTKYKLIVDYREELKKTKKGKIFIVNHRQSDDIVSGVNAIGESGFIVFGNKILVLESFRNGYGLWANGVIILDRDDPEIVILNMTTRDSTIYHEFEHFNGSRKDYSSYVNVTFQNDKFVNDIYGEHYPVHGRLFEEGLVSSFTQDIGYIDSYSYPNDQKVVDIYTYIFGPELMLEAHQSDGKINVLLNAVLELGFTKEEVLDIFLRLDLYHQLMYIYDDGNVNLDFLSYQIIDNLTQIYEKKYHKPFTEDQTFCLLIDAFLNIEKGYNIESELLDSGYIAYSKELLDIINSQESLIETYFPPELYFDHSFKIFSINIESQFFSTLEKNTKIEVILTDNPGQQIGEYQMIFLTFDYKENKLILRNISMEKLKFVQYIQPKEEEIKDESSIMK